MIIDQTELERRLKSENNLAQLLPVRQDEPRRTPQTLVEEKPKQARTPQIQDESIRILAGTLAHLDKPANVARELGLTPQQVHSAAHSKKDSVRSKVEETRDRVSELALNQLLGALGLMDAASLVGEKPKDLSLIAANLSRVVNNMSPRDATASQAGAVQVVIYAPQQKTEDKYTVIDV